MIQLYKRENPVLKLRDENGKDIEATENAEKFLTAVVTGVLGITSLHKTR